MAVKCIHCGGSCHELANGEYACDFCGATFLKEELVRTSGKPATPEAKNGDIGVEVFEKNINGVLEIATSIGRGSGYLISLEGYAITNSHVVALEDGKPCGQCTVKVVGETVSASVIAMGAANRSMFCSNADLALIKLSRVPQKATALQFEQASVRTGERIFVIGNSLGAGTCITSGIISDNNRNGRLMYDCPTNPGNSGGPVFNSEGYVIGTHVAGTQPDGIKVQGMNFAIPVRAVMEFLNKLK